MRTTQRFTLNADWFTLGYKIMFADPDTGETIIYDHDKNFRYWAENIRRNPETKHHLAKSTPKWIIKFKKKTT